MELEWNVGLCILLVVCVFACLHGEGRLYYGGTRHPGSLGCQRSGTAARDG